MTQRHWPNDYMEDFYLKYITAMFLLWQFQGYFLKESQIGHLDEC